MAKKVDYKQVAIEYGKRGEHILPVSKNKRPINSNGCKGASSNSEQINQWWSKNPEANIGLATGIKNNLTVIDYDLKGTKAPVYDFLMKLGNVSNLKQVRTGSGGMHGYFLYEESLKNTARILPYIDIRTEGGYVIVPPSIHESGEYYKNLGGIVQKMPSQILKVLTMDKAKRSEHFSITKENEGRNHKIFNAILLFRGYLEVPEERVFEVTQSYNQTFCDPPLPDYELQAVYQSALNYEVEEPSSTISRKKNDFKELIEHLLKYVILFRTKEKLTFAKIKINDSEIRILPLSHREFKLFVSRIFYQAYEAVISDNKMKSFLQHLEFIALYDSPIEDVYTRVAHVGNKMYIDSANEQGQIFEVSKNGTWRVIEDVSINFYRPSGLLPLPTPTLHTDLALIKDTLFSGWDSSDSFFLLILAFMIKSLTHNTGPFPILCISGLQGSGKSVLSSSIKHFVDPNKASLRTPPEKVEDLMLSGLNSHLICIDNISYLNNKMSDACCSIATGAGFSARKLYTNDEEFLLSIIKPMLINGISPPTSRPDFLERSLVIDLPQINSRKAQYELDKEFDEAKSKIMGFLLYLLAHTYKLVDDVKLKKPPRMADFARWGTAMCLALGYDQDHFMNLYLKNSNDLSQKIFDDSPLAIAISQILTFQKSWTGKSSDLLNKIRSDLNLEHIYNERLFPKTPEAIGKGLRRITPILRQNDYEIEFKKRSITITNKKFKEPSDEI